MSAVCAKSRPDTVSWKGSMDMNIYLFDGGSVFQLSALTLFRQIRTFLRMTGIVHTCAKSVFFKIHEEPGKEI